MKKYRLRSVVAVTAMLAVAFPTVAAAAEPDPSPTYVTSEAGIVAESLGGPGLTDKQIEKLIQKHEARQAKSSSKSSDIVLMGTADYYSYCEEGASGLMVWTNNDPKYCYGWYYEYQNGSRISKVNMLKLKAEYASLNPSSPPGPNLITWCNNNGFYCAVAFYVGDKLGVYLLGLLL